MYACTQRNQNVYWPIDGLNLLRGRRSVLLICLPFLFQVGGAKKAPSANTLRQWIKICTSIGEEALRALRAVTDQEVPGYKAINVNLLTDSRVLPLASKPQTQALFFNIYAR